MRRVGDDLVGQVARECLWGGSGHFRSYLWVHLCGDVRAGRLWPCGVMRPCEEMWSCGEVRHCDEMRSGLVEVSFWRVWC